MSHTNKNNDAAADAPYPWLERVLSTPEQCIPIMRVCVDIIHRTYGVYVEAPPTIRQLCYVLDTCERHKRYEPLPLLFLTFVKIIDTIAAVVREQLRQEYSEEALSDAHWSLLQSFIDTALITFALNSLRKDNIIEHFERFNDYVRTIILQQRYQDMYRYVMDQRDKHGWPERMDEHFEGAVPTALIRARERLLEKRANDAAAAADGGGAVVSTNTHDSNAITNTADILEASRQVVTQQAHLYTLAESCIRDDTALVESVVAYPTVADMVDVEE
jgi:hypothetical protein